MKAILMSIKPKWVARILNGYKTIEVRKTAPKCELPIDVYIYCTKKGGLMRDVTPVITYFVSSPVGPVTSNESERLEGKVVAKFTLRKVEEYKVWDSFNLVKANGIDKHSPSEILEGSYLSGNELVEYLGGISGKRFCAWHISDLVIFDKPKKLWEFDKAGSYNNPTVKCKKKEQGRCNHGESPFTGKWVGCEKARLTKAPQSWCYVEAVE